MKPLVAFDESGNSGGNLPDSEQPVFVLASVSLPDQDAHEVLHGRDGECKFSHLKRSVSGRRFTVDVLNSPHLTDDTFLFSAYHKKFMAVTKIVDLLVEPLAHRDGVDLYERGANLGLANLWYYCLPVFLGPKVFDLLVARFVHMVRFPSQRTIQEFYQLVETAYRKHQGESYAADIAVLLATRVIADAYRERWDGGDLDPAIPSFVEHSSIWTARLGTPFMIVHDASKPIANEQILLEAMMSETDARQEIGYDRRKMVFPIAAREIELRDSMSCVQLQIADIIAGSVAHCLRASIRKDIDDHVRSLLETNVLGGSLRGVWPELKVTPEEFGTTDIGGIDAIDHIGDYVAKRLRDGPERVIYPVTC